MFLKTRKINSEQRVAYRLHAERFTLNANFMPEQEQKINIKIPDEVLKGAYSNLMFVSHTKEEFVMDFINVFGPQGIEVAKVMTSPGHFKRIVAALNDNLKKFENQFGSIDTQQTTNEPTTSESSKFGF